MKEIFDEIEEKIILDFLNGKSIREISEDIEKDYNKSYGRTKISNILEKYAMQSVVNKEKINERKIKNKTHKKTLEGYSDNELEEIDIKKAYNEIMRGMTLTDVSKKYGRTRDFIKSRIIDYINDEDEEKAFLDILDSNRKRVKKDYFELSSKDEKKSLIFKKLNDRRKVNNRPQYSNEFLEKKFEKLKKYFLETRNSKTIDQITEDDFLSILYDTPTLLSSSLTNKIIPAINNLDASESIGPEVTNIIIRADSSILCSSIERTNLQIKILEESDLLRACIKKPRNFRTSPEMMYALIGIGKKRDVEKPEDIFLTKGKLKSKYNIEPEELMSMFDVHDEYGDDEYFK